MRRTILLSIPAVSAMTNWSPVNLHLPAALSALLHPTSRISEHGEMLAPAEALKETAASHDQDQESSVVVVINPALDAVLASASKTRPESDTNADADADTQFAQIEEADTDFVSPFLPPPPTIAKGDTEAPISSHTRIPEAASSADTLPLSVIVAVVDDTGYLADEYLPVTDPTSSSADITAEATPGHDGEDEDYEHNAGHALVSSSDLESVTTTTNTLFLDEKLNCFKEKLQALHHQSTTYLIPTSAFQWLIFALSFSCTLLLVGGRVVLVALRRRHRHRHHHRQGSALSEVNEMEDGDSEEEKATALGWEKLKVAGVEVGMVQRRVLKRGECVWVMIPAGRDGQAERMEKVWLEDGVGVRGREVWDKSMV